MSKTEKNLSKSLPATPQKPAVKETPKPEDYLYKTVSAFFPDDREMFFEALKAVIVKATPVNSRDRAIQSFTRVFNEQMSTGNIVRYFDIADVGIGLTVCEDMVKIFDHLDSLLDTLDEMPEDAAERRFANLIRPAVECFRLLVGSHFPALKWIRKHLEERGYDQYICG